MGFVRVKDKITKDELDVSEKTFERDQDKDKPRYTRVTRKAYEDVVRYPRRPKIFVDLSADKDSGAPSGDINKKED